MYSRLGGSMWGVVLYSMSGIAPRRNFGPLIGGRSHLLVATYSLYSSGAPLYAFS